MSQDQDQTLQQLLTARVALFATGDKPKAIIDDHVEKMFKEVIGDCFRSYGDMGKAVSAAIKAALPSNISDMFELTRYNALVERSLQTQWESSGIEGDMVRRAQKCMADALAEDTLPSVISLRALLEEFAESNKESATEGQWESPEVRIEASQYGGGVNIFFDKTPESDYATNGYSKRERRHDYSLANRIHVRWDDKNPDLDPQDHHIGEVYSAQLDDAPVGRNFSIKSKWERMLAALYFGSAKVVIDCDADDISYGIYD
jgi:hypothetical protein